MRSQLLSVTILFLFALTSDFALSCSEPADTTEVTLSADDEKKLQEIMDPSKLEQLKQDLQQRISPAQPSLDTMISDSEIVKAKQDAVLKTIANCGLWIQDPAIKLLQSGASFNECAHFLDSISKLYLTKPKLAQELFNVLLEKLNSHNKNVLVEIANQFIQTLNSFINSDNLAVHYPSPLEKAILNTYINCLEDETFCGKNLVNLFTPYLKRTCNLTTQEAKEIHAQQEGSRTTPYLKRTRNLTTQEAEKIHAQQRRFTIRSTRLTSKQVAKLQTERERLRYDANR